MQLSLSLILVSRSRRREARWQSLAGAASCLEKSLSVKGHNDAALRQVGPEVGTGYRLPHRILISDLFLKGTMTPPFAKWAREWARAEAAATQVAAKAADADPEHPLGSGCSETPQAHGASAVILHGGHVSHSEGFNTWARMTPEEADKWLMEDAHEDRPDSADSAEPAERSAEPIELPTKKLRRSSAAHDSLDTLA